MRSISKSFAIPTLVASLVGLISVQAIAQDAPIEFRVVATDRNPATCRQWDSELARVHTFTAAGDSATLRTAGGITRTMTQSSPKVFTTTLALGGTNFNVVADTSKAPGTLEVAEPRAGCRWNAIAR
jgi:hypothetical protein